MIDLRPHLVALGCTIALLSVLPLLDACGKLTVEHDVNGTVQFQLQQDPALYTPFFLSDCLTRTSAQSCYSTDPATCATCMSNALYASLPIPK